MREWRALERWAELPRLAPPRARLIPTDRLATRLGGATGLATAHGSDGTPWSAPDAAALSLLAGLLEYDPAKREGILKNLYDALAALGAGDSALRARERRDATDSVGAKSAKFSAVAQHVGFY